MLCEFFKLFSTKTLFRGFSDCRFFRSANGHALPLGSNDVQLSENTGNKTCQVGHEEYSGLSFHKLDWTRQTVEPRTGIEFPMLLKENASRSNSEVLIAFLPQLLFFFVTTYVRVSGHSHQRIDIEFRKN